MPRGKIIDLRRLLAEKFPQEPLPASTARLVTGLPIFDEILEGGLTKGAITELTSTAPNAGTASIIAALLQRACRDNFFLALVDGHDSFDPQSIGRLPLRNLLWIRCHNASEAMRATDLVLRDGNFPLVILDLVLNPIAELRKVPSSYWYRLQRLVEPAPTALLALTPRRMISSAHWKLSLENRWQLVQLDWPASELHGQLKFHLDRAHSNKWHGEEVAC
jgi:hypothetical protein